jgi:hypothetical protein
VICVPIFIVGFSDRAGSWNTMAMSPPRSLRSSFSSTPMISRPSRRIDPLMAAVGGSNPIRARELTLLPDPDSPMIAIILPGTIS